MAGLLRDHLGARGGDAKTAAAEARRGRNPPPVQDAAPSVVQATPAKENKEPRAVRKRAPAPVEAPAELDDVTAPHARVEVPSAPAPATPPGPAPATLELFVNVGRREGVRPSDVQKLLADKGLPAEAIGRIRVRDRMTYLDVAKDASERVIAALTGEVIGGRTVVAEVARARG